jgi:hypothetical protein
MFYISKIEKESLEKEIADNINKIDMKDISQSTKYIPNDMINKAKTIFKKPHKATVINNQWLFKIMKMGKFLKAQLKIKPTVIRNMITNLKIKMVDSSNNVLEGSWAYVYYAEKTNTAIKNANPGISYPSGSGIGEVFLEDGIWSLQVEAPYNNALYSRTSLTVKVASGSVTEVKNAAGETLTASSGYFLVQLPSANLKGTITFGDETYTSSSLVYVKRLNGNYFEYVEGRWVYNGVFGFKVTPGTYQIEVRPYSSSDNGPVTTYVSNCVVASSGTTTCNVALSSGNLSGKITNELGDTYRYSYASIWKMVNGQYQDGQGVEVNSGVFRANLADGIYRIRV